MPIIETRFIDDIDLTQDQSRDWKEEYLPACDGDAEMADECFRLSHINDGRSWIPLEQYSSIEANKEIMGDSESDDLDFGDLKESDLREAWSDSARKASAEARKHKASGKGGVGFEKGGTKMSPEKKARQLQHIKDSYGKKSTASAGSLKSSEIEELNNLSRRNEWNEQNVSATNQKIEYSDYDEAKAEGDHLTFEALSNGKWKVTKAESAYGFDNGKGKDIREGDVFTKSEAISLTMKHYDSRSYVMRDVEEN